MRYCRGCHGEDGRGGAHTFMPHVEALTKRGFGSFPTDFCLRVDTGERLWSSSYDESSDSANLIRIGHRVAAAVARARANPCGILHRERLVDTARRVTKADPCRGRGVAIALGCHDGWCDIAGSPVGAGRTGCRRVSRLHLGGLVSFLDSISGPSGARSSSGVPGWCAANVLRRGCGDRGSRSDERASRQHDPPAQADRAARSARGRGRGLCRKSDGQRCGSCLRSGPAGAARTASGQDPVAALCRAGGAHDRRSRRPQPPGAGQSNLVTPW